MSVSLVARRNGISSSLLFRWRRLMVQQFSTPMAHAGTTPVSPPGRRRHRPALRRHRLAAQRAGPSPGGPGGFATNPVRRAACNRPLVLGGVFGAVGVAALAVIGVLVLGSHGGGSPAPLTPTAGTHSLAATRRSTAVAPSASAKTSYAVDSCLVGNWKDAGDVLDNTIHGQRAQFTGKGGGIEVSADGGATEQFGPETLTATIDGNVWTEVLGGSAAMHATTSHGQLVLSDIAASPDATYKLYENGVFDSTGPTSVSTTPTRYTCSPSTLRLYWSDGTSVYDRAIYHTAIRPLWHPEPSPHNRLGALLLCVREGLSSCSSRSTRDTCFSPSQGWSSPY